MRIHYLDPKILCNYLSTDSDRRTAVHRPPHDPEIMAAPALARYARERCFPARNW